MYYININNYTTMCNLLLFLYEQTSGEGPKIDRNTGKHTRPLNNPNPVFAINM